MKLRYETTLRTAIDPTKNNQSYRIPFPSLEEIRSAILNLDLTEGIKIKETMEELAVHFNLSDEQKAAEAESKHNIFYHMVDSAITTLVKKGKLHKPGGDGTPYFFVPEEEQEEDIEIEEEQERVVPTVEDIEDIYEKVHKELAEELLKEIKSKSKRSPFFESLVIKLLLEMGYGGFEEDAGEVVGGSGDGGIDGIIKQDKLGVDEVYVQAKNKNEKIGAPAIRDFIGALDGKRAQKGIFITISDFTLSAEQAADRSTKKIVLINGTQLAKLMIEHNVGVSTSKTYEIKRVDSDYFAETE